MVNQKPEIDLGRLRAIANEATTKGEWGWFHAFNGEVEVFEANGTMSTPTVLHFKDYADCEECSRPDAEDVEHIATFDPPTVLALLDRLEAAEAKVARVEELAEWADDRGSVWSGILSTHRIRKALAGDGS